MRRMEVFYDVGLFLFFLDYPGKQIDTIKLPVQIFERRPMLIVGKIELVTDDTRVNTAPEELYGLIGGVVRQTSNCSVSWN
ncbi:MAG: hypothetical protein ACLU4N_24285 [Butyricimonas faecihominis]